MNIKKDDKVKVLSGKDKGLTAKILKALPLKGRVLVEGVNVVKKHQKAKMQGQKSEIISKEAPIDVSNVQLICPKCSKATRIGKREVSGKLVRVCKKCQAEV